MLALKALTLKARIKKLLQVKLENIGLDPGWEIDSCLNVIIHYSKKLNVIRVHKNGGKSVRVFSGSINPNDFERRYFEQI